MKNHYDILGLSRNCTADDIKKAYRRLSLKFHPDKNEGDTYFAEMFKQVNEAYNVLYDPIKRVRYDSELFVFEHPEPVIKNVYKEAPAASTYYESQTVPVFNKWAAVHKWRRIRNYMLITNALLILLLFGLSENGHSRVQTAVKDTTITPSVRKKHRHRHHIQKTRSIQIPESSVDTGKQITLPITPEQQQDTSVTSPNLPTGNS